MTDLPDDARRTLARHLDEASEAARERRVEDALDALDRALAVVERVDRPTNDLRERLDHGRERVADLAADEPLVAAEYCRAMRDLVVDPDADGSESTQ